MHVATFAAFHTQAEGGMFGWGVTECTCVPDHEAVCSEDYTPVCGADGATYANKCKADAACQFDSTAGACPCPTYQPMPNSACNTPGQRCVFENYTCVDGTTIDVTVGSCENSQWMIAIAMLYPECTGGRVVR